MGDELTRQEGGGLASKSMPRRDESDVNLATFDIGLEPVQELYHRPDSFEAPRHQHGGSTPLLPGRCPSITEVAVVQQRHPSLDDVSSNMEGGATPLMPRRNVSIVSKSGGDMPKALLDPNLLPSPPLPSSKRIGGATPKIPIRRTTALVKDEKDRAEIATASAEWPLQPPAPPLRCGGDTPEIPRRRVTAKLKNEKIWWLWRLRQRR
eukprot:scaffold1893_cov220-Amphora_coffeaeformis.AAC.2